MAAETQSGDHLEKFGWLIVDFPLNESHLEEFLVFLGEFVKTFSPKADIYGQGSVFTVENVAYFPYLDPTNRPKQAGWVTFEGYEIFHGKQRFIKELIAFSVQPSSSDLMTISGVPNPELILYFSNLLLEISKRWEESSPSIAKYLSRVELIIETSKKEENQKVEVTEAKGSESNAPTNSVSDERTPKPDARRRRPKMGAPERVAISLYSYEKGEFPNITQAAKRFGTLVKTIRRLENDSKVKELVEEMRRDQRYADKIRQKVANQNRKVNKGEKD